MATTTIPAQGAVKKPKWAFQYLVQGSHNDHPVIETMDSADYANKLAIAVHGKVWPIEAVADYDTKSVSIKASHSLPPLASY